MRQLSILWTGLFVIALIAPAFADHRAVLFEDFLDEQCTSCTQVAEVLEQMRANFSREELVIISYTIDGAGTLDDSVYRHGREFYDLGLVPQVVVDGQDVVAQPTEYSNMLNYYTARANVPTSLMMEVIPESDTQYRIRVHAESPVQGRLMAVAYEDITYANSHYSCFARQFLTPFDGEPVSITPGNPLDIVKTVNIQAGWNPSAMGVVAWIHGSGRASAGDDRFYPDPVMQAADSRAEHTNPTPTPTPTPPEGTPTPTPPYTCDTLGVKIDMPSNFFRPGQPFYCNVKLCNPTHATYSDVPLFVILDVGGHYFFAPSFGSYDNYSIELVPGVTEHVVLPEFQWPGGAGTANNIAFYSAMTDAGVTELFGDYDMFMFGWGN